jgi:hypothetical protein
MNVPRVIGILVGAILIGACASTVQNTPRQDLIWSAYQQCRTDGRIPTSIQLTRVEPDGRAWYSAYRSAYGAQELERCINEKVSPPPTYVPVFTQ